MTVYDVDGYDLNFWFDEEAGGWKANAYPYDVEGNFLGGNYRVWFNMDVTDVDVAELQLGYRLNEYSSDNDFWADARWMISDYPHLSASFMPKIIALPKKVEIKENKLMKVEE